MNHRSRNQQKPAFIADNFNSLEQVTSALRESGLESSNLILGIDFTKSNEWTGRRSFGRKSLHAIGSTPNPYEQAISIIGRTLSAFDEDSLIPCFGFGDASTRDQYVFSFFADHRPCHGFVEALERYRQIAPHLNLSGPTSFAPLIHAAIDIVDRSNGQYHVLVIIADGQVTRNPDVPKGSFSLQERATIDAIAHASLYPLSIIMVGVGDGPWHAMQQFDDSIPQREFDNFQFVNFTKIMSSSMEIRKMEAAFALAALMEIPFQYKATQVLRPIKKRVGQVSASPVRPRPSQVVEMDNAANSASSSISTPTEQACPICLTNQKDMTFGCGHLTCKSCGATLERCPICRAAITVRVRLYV
ncbi:E3 ubiquitin-protein ligase RGLG3 isoform X1 [Dendrobium catenatum]|uniref:E3 ubiquitin-protein ligase RGLG3 isoform X1 n=1 Tax=Dendrobium catenatum TaxID=906689 RepID=UPI00109F9CF3|nr:E3 ubiquitin-protein ligase RGLG3 isoform X1 [Dendrobium catenatum]